MSLVGTFNVCGTGIVPIHLASADYFGGIYGYSHTVTVEARCPVCKTISGQIANLSRDFISLFYIPIFPLGLSTVVECYKCKNSFRLPLNKYDKEKMIRTAAIRTTYLSLIWLTPFIFSLLGAYVGLYWISKFNIPALAVLITIVLIVLISHSDSLYWVPNTTKMIIFLMLGILIVSIANYLLPLISSYLNIFGVLLGLGIFNGLFLFIFCRGKYS